MTAGPPIVSHTAIKVNNEELPAAVREQIIEITVDQHVHLPTMFTVRLYDPELKLLDQGPFALAGKVAISSKTAVGKTIKLLDGEITALEPDLGKGMIAELTVRGYDRAHRLYRERRSKTYLNVKDSDLATQIARRANLTAEVEPTATVYEHLYQHNQSDLEFLRRRAWRIGYECFVWEDKLFFRKPVTGKAVLTAAWGQDLLTFRPRLALAEQVEELWVKGWDVQKKTAIVGRATEGQRYPQNGEPQDGKGWAQRLGQTSRTVIVDQPVVSQSEADIIARARLDEISGAFITAEGEAFRRPDIGAGQWIKLEGLGQRLSGDYLVTRATHHHSDAGLTTTFAVTGARDGLLLEQLLPAVAHERWGSVVSAIVTNTDDPNGWGRVKVKYPWLADEEESGWARVLSIGGGPQCGLAVVPAVDDEVMVLFLQGDFDSPLVLGGVWNGVDAMPAPVVNAAEGEKPLVRSWHSRTGHHITTYDAEKKIVIQSAGGLTITLDDNDAKIVINSSGEIAVTADQVLTLKGQSVKIEAAADMVLEASGEVTVTGRTINLN